MTPDWQRTKTLLSYTVTDMSSVRDRRVRSGAKKHHLRGAGAITLILRTRAPLRRDTDVTYAASMAERRVDRGEWANVLAQLIAEEAAGNKSAFARMAGTTYRTVVRWLKQEVDVSEDKVREIARALRISPVTLLVRVGYYEHGELERSGPPTPEQIAADPALKVIEETDFPPRVKARMRQRLFEMRQKRLEAELDEIKWWIEQTKDAS
jgi:DNA-binding transcriptional regulator YdaS (Cro superfamily)